MFVVEDNARSHLAYSVTALTSLSAECICLRAGRTKRRIRTVEELALEIREVAAFLAHHLVKAAMELDGAWPWCLVVQWNLRRQRWHRSLDAINVLGVESRQAIFLGQSS